MGKTEKLTVRKQERLDKYLSAELKTTRNQIEALIKSGYVKVNGKTVKKGGIKLKVGETIEIEYPEVRKSEAKEPGFDVEIIYEDEDILVLNKPSGVTVHPAPSVKEPTLVDWLKKRGVSLSTISGEERHGIVHRIDKETSGVLVIAKNDSAHLSLSKQLQDKSMGRYYLAIIEPPLKEDTVVEKPIGRNPKNRIKMAVVPNGREAKTAFAKIALSKDQKTELIGAKLFTGRTHQIRVHLNAIGRHILGDCLYGFKSRSDKIKRVFLHAYILYLRHPKTGTKMRFVAPLPDDMREFLKKRFDWESINEKIVPEQFDTIFDSVS
ncbi:RluA family pseudouridine synthase [Nitrosophilus alvini]|uniref:RluA family pseudouridine synthase n=1 Tax=Nitrosophilus alvini TaxID=2714855 RepID=UPI00190BBCA7|nr:RluA family pseudouridine synthase [Nitrosophilus alvini]